ncbi:hypothetical protein [Mycolicibacterium fortuitum]|uniref:Uncharacterized protein n=2 Tax=Mycolicibacterium fortuitum TaxID=1766 RepID=A0AAE5AER7_MYCFO|nr:hypothetical protein [Mycolicibacterium fortuitum]MCV7137888.1 hypothetical protein [Mycolicibacterium fortuitum]MDV7195380.1 hypothetical protein [Mycolicibacterium fortuitum]MDV7209101.1 hypothetical protein [Mycolicibacterium fortuitum]MDV7229222.1 hypothetical protein [Mycolicibacterium fortuitum]MDV7260921.1 hypothetical protein [Mycolicibacterium fortuitum]
MEKADQDTADALQAAATNFHAMIDDFAEALREVQLRQRADRKMPWHLMQVVKAKARACLEVGAALQADGVLDAGANTLIEQLRRFIDEIQQSMDRQLKRREAIAAADSVLDALNRKRAKMEQIIADAEAAAEPTVYHGITVRSDANGVATSVIIGEQALNEYTHTGLGRAVTQALQTSHDHMITTVAAQLAAVVGDDAARTASTTSDADEAEFVETYGRGQLSVAVDRHGRPVACTISPEATAWDLPVLGDRVAGLCRLAQLTAQFDRFRPCNETGKYGQLGPVEADLDAARAALA